MKYESIFGCLSRQQRVIYGGGWRVNIGRPIPTFIAQLAIMAASRDGFPVVIFEKNELLPTLVPSFFTRGQEPRVITGSHGGTITLSTIVENVLELNDRDGLVLAHVEGLRNVEALELFIKSLRGGCLYHPPSKAPHYRVDYGKYKAAVRRVYDRRLTLIMTYDPTRRDWPRPLSDHVLKYLITLYNQHAPVIEAMKDVEPISEWVSKPVSRYLNELVIALVDLEKDYELDDTFAWDKLVGDPKNVRTGLSIRLRIIGGALSQEFGREVAKLLTKWPEIPRDPGIKEWWKRSISRFAAERIIRAAFESGRDEATLAYILLGGVGSALASLKWDIDKSDVVAALEETEKAVLWLIRYGVIGQRVLGDMERSLERAKKKVLGLMGVLEESMLETWE